MTETPTLPLLSLPDDEIIRKLREMNLKEVLKFSLISERSKELVKSTEIKGHFISICIGSDICVSTLTDSGFLELHCYTEPDMYWGMGEYGRKKKLAEPQSILVKAPRSGTEDTTSEMKKGGFTMKDWLDHLQQIFDHRKIDHIRFSNDSSQFDMNDIKEVFGTIDYVTIGNTGCYAFSQMVLEFFPIEILRIKTSDLPNSKIPEKVLMQNFDKLRIGELREITSMTFDELLLVNSKVIHIQGLQIPAKQFNKFIKLWQNGSNPRMEHLIISHPQLNHWDVYLETDEENDKRIITEGIEHCVNPTDKYRNFKVARSRHPVRVFGGIDILRNDGVKATILLKNRTFPVWSMYVWFDHCCEES